MGQSSGLESHMRTQRETRTSEPTAPHGAWGTFSLHPGNNSPPLWKLTLKIFGIFTFDRYSSTSTFFTCRFSVRLKINKIKYLKYTWCSVMMNIKARNCILTRLLRLSTFFSQSAIRIGVMMLRGTTITVYGNWAETVFLAKIFSFPKQKIVHPLHAELSSLKVENPTVEYRLLISVAMTTQLGTVELSHLVKHSKWHITQSLNVVSIVGIIFVILPTHNLRITYFIFFNMQPFEILLLGHNQHLLH